MSAAARNATDRAAEANLLALAESRRVGDRRSSVIVSTNVSSRAPRADELACTLVGLPTPVPADAPWRPVGITRRGDVMVLAVAARGGVSFDVLIERRDDSRPAYRRTAGGLNVSYAGQRDEAVVGEITAEIAARLGATRIDAFTAAIPPDLRVGGWADRPHHGLYESWQHPDRWRLFFADAEIERARADAIEVDLDCVRVEHGDLECQFVGHGTFVRTPWRRRSGALATPSAGVGMVGSEFFTDLRDLDVIDGSGPDKLDSLLGAVHRELRPELLSVHCVCVPMVIGDDVKPLIERERQRARCPVLYEEQGVEHLGAPADLILQQLRDSDSLARDPRAINLVGFGAGADVDEMVELLGRMGIRVNASLIPGLSPRAAACYRAAGVQVVADTTAWRPLIERALDGLDLRTLSPPPPWGLARSLAWLREVAASVDRASECAEVLRALAPGIARFVERKEEARGLAVGLVVGPEHVARLRDPALAYGMPLVSLVKEMGFSLRIALFAGDPGAASLAERDLGELLDEPGDVARFTKPAELTHWLTTTPMQAVYGEYTYDHRISSAGKASFGPDVFEMGIDGAVRSLERLLALARLPFYAKFGRFLTTRARPK